MTCDLFVFAGEKSGDLHGEKLLEALYRIRPGLKIAGVGGPNMRLHPMACVLPMEEFQVMGFVDVFLSLPKLVGHFYFIFKEIRRLKPKIVLTIDYPGFNLRLIKKLRKKGFTGKCIHFICPSVWAWGKKRIPLMEKNLDLLLAILPFEKKIFASSTLPVSYVGHPLVQRLKEHKYLPLLLPEGKKIIALFPGSRKKEIQRNLPIYLDVCKELKKSHSDLYFILSVSQERYQPLLAQILKEKDWIEEKEIALLPATYSYEMMKASYIALAKSGTVTLELAMHLVPTVVTYGVSFLDKIIAYDILRIRLPFYCIVNIIMQKEIFTELIGPHFTLEKTQRETEKLFKNECYLQVRNECKQLLLKLGSEETSKKAAEKVLELLD